MKKTLAVIISSIVLYSCNNQETPATDAEKTADAAADSRDYEFGESKYVDLSKKGFADLAKGDVDGWMAGFADNAVYRWNNGDSLSGKAAITEYWKKRRAEVIETLAFSNEIWLPINVHKASVEVQRTGNYVLNWNMVDAKYKNGKNMIQFMHTILHFDANDKIDEIIQYLDRAPIQAAMTK